MGDLYDAAAALPRLLRGGLPVQRRRDLLGRGVSARAIQWRVGKGQLVRVSRNTYVLGQEPDLLDRVRATMLVMPPDAVIGYHTAAALHGFGVVRSTDIHVVVPAGTPVPQRRGVTAHESVIPTGEATLRIGFPCTAPARTAVDLARTVRRQNALPVLDAGLRVGAFSKPQLAAEIARHGRLRGVRQVRELSALADPRAECRQESQLRLLLHDNGVRGFEPQVRVYDEHGRPVCRIDLADEATRAGLEYDGISHYGRDRAKADRRRHNWLAARGWTMRYFTDTDLYGRPDYLVQLAVAAQRDQGARNAS
jgi:very-short-patch-repair endonuclease